MAKWRECKLGDIIELIGGGTPKTSVPEYWDGDIPWLSVVDFNTGNKFVYTTEKTITKAGLENSSTKILNPGDIIVSARGTIGAMAVLKKPMAFNQSCYGVRNIEGVSDKDYLYYLLKDSVSNLQQIAHGGVFDTITRETFDSIDVPLPSLSEQRAIAAVLSSLDDKIDLLHRQNKTLESLASALWRKAFVEDANTKWIKRSLVDVIDLVGGGTPKTDVPTYWDGEIPWLSAKDITVNHQGFVFKTEKSISKAGLDNSFAKILPKYSTIISARGTVGNYCLLSSPMAFSQSNYGILPKIDRCYFFTHLLIAHIVGELKAVAYGSVFDTITTKSFAEQQVELPNNVVISEFEKTVTGYFEKIYANTKQIYELSHLQNKLLMQLIGGNMRVSV